MSELVLLYRPEVTGNETRSRHGQTETPASTDAKTHRTQKNRAIEARSEAFKWHSPSVAECMAAGPDT